jgi:hypothetical protein
MPKRTRRRRGVVGGHHRGEGVTAVGRAEQRARAGQREARRRRAAADLRDVPGRDALDLLALPGRPTVLALQDDQAVPDRVEGRGVDRVEGVQGRCHRGQLRPGDAAVLRSLDRAAGRDEAGRAGGAVHVRRLTARHRGAPGERAPAVGGRQHAAAPEKQVADVRRWEGERREPGRAGCIARGEGHSEEVLATVVGAAEGAAAAGHDALRLTAGDSHAGEPRREARDDAAPRRAGIRALQQRAEGARGVTRLAGAREVVELVGPEQRVARVPAGLRCVDARGRGREQRRGHDERGETGKQAMRPQGKQAMHRDPPSFQAPELEGSGAEDREELDRASPPEAIQAFAESPYGIRNGGTDFVTAC